MFDFIHLEFFTQALAAGILVGGVCAFLGVQVVLKRVVFAGAALAEIASAGLALGFYLGFGTHGYGAIAFALAVTLGAAALFAYPSRNRVLPQESLIAIAFVTGSAVAIILVSRSAEGVQELDHLLSGHLLTARLPETLFDATIFSALIMIYIFFYKEILYVSFDPETARSAGLSPRVWNLLFYQVLGLVIGLSIRSAGTLLVVAYLVLPAAGALLATRRLLSAHLVSVLLACAGTATGLSASFIWDIPAGGAIVASLCVLAGVCLVTDLLRRS